MLTTSHMITTNDKQHSTPLVFVQIPPGSISHGLTTLEVKLSMDLMNER